MDYIHNRAGKLSNTFRTPTTNTIVFLVTEVQIGSNMQATHLQNFEFCDYEIQQKFLIGKILGLSE